VSHVRLLLMLALVGSGACATGPAADSGEQLTAPPLTTAAASVVAPRPSAVPEPSTASEDRRAREATGVSLVELPLPKGEPAVVSVPEGEGPRPLIVATHGAGGLARVHCRLWQSIVGARGFVLCPRGHRIMPHEPNGVAGYFYDGHPALGREISLALEALRQRYGGRVDMTAPLFAGYSQGAGMGSMLLPNHPARFARAVLVEGGFGEYQEWNIAVSRQFHERGGAKVLLGCGRIMCLELARTTASYMRRAGLQTKVVYADVGHSYDGPLYEQIRDSFAWLVEGDPRW
jgi:predicted esterase